MKLPRQIYAIRHEPTQKMYIGSSANVCSRFKAHISHLRRGTHPVEDMQADFDRYGGDYQLFILGEIQTFSERSLEYGWMIRYATYDRRHGYNYKDQFIKHHIPETSNWRDDDIIEILLRNAHT